MRLEKRCDCFNEVSCSRIWPSKNIRINSLCPGAFRTPMLEERFSNLSSDEKVKLNESYQKLNALGRIGDPLEAAKAVKWLLSMMHLLLRVKTLL